MSPAPRLVLKQASGWFAAGWSFGDAMGMLSDAAFKLFAWVCLNADRQTGRVRISISEIAVALGKSEAQIQAASEELAGHGVCHWLNGEIEVADRYWPYEKQPSESGPRDYVTRVRQLLSEPACVRCRFTMADEKMARQLYQRGITLAQVERAIWLGCARKYATLLANGSPWMPIASLSYFTGVIEEVVTQANTSDAYWAYVRRKAVTLEREWTMSLSARTGASSR